MSDIEGDYGGEEDHGDYGGEDGQYEEYNETDDYGGDGTDYGMDYGEAGHEHDVDLKVDKPQAISQAGALLEYQEKLIGTIRSKLGEHISTNVARLFLSHCNWDVSRVEDKYWDDQEELYAACGLNNPNEEIVVAAAPKGSYECSVCLEDTEDYLQNPTCGHYFCRTCWRAGIENDIVGGNVFKIKCFHINCKELVPDDIIQSLVSPQLWEKYRTYLGNKFVDGANDVRWCIANDCKNAITQSSLVGNQKVGVCPCGTVFCWNKECASQSHCPASCDEYTKWKEKNGSSDFQSQKWILENTKKCIKCKSPVSKQDGCFQMTCRPPCSQQFCWLCSEDWKTHSDHFRCKKHPEAGSPSDVGNRVLYLTDVKWEGDELFVKLLDRYNFYAKAQKDAKDAYPKISAVINQLVADKILLNPKPLDAAKITLEECRRIVQGMIIVRGVNMNSSRQLAQAFQVKQFEEKIAELSNKFEKELLTLEHDFPKVTKFVDEVQKIDKILSTLAQNIVAQGL
eukprot:TRINITY_DN4413_c0_g1_i1.p1 TRINITY_DN4413_c0_g1~~TRINITY_DN4413_c0_g1_i1.p1  ORF type:complete len:511 (+),score=108.70 TRINITY_DN4413_c0_g1_i1:79-1611(+)